MVIICFQDDTAQRRALGYLPGRFPFSSWVTGEMGVPEEALAALSREAIPFQVEDAPAAEPTRAEAIAAYLRGESRDPVDAFAEMAGTSRGEWLQRVAVQKTKAQREAGA